MITKQDNKRGGGGSFYQKDYHQPNLSPRPLSPSFQQNNDQGKSLSQDNHQTFQSLLSQQVRKTFKNYCRYRNRVDSLRSNKQKLLALCKLRASNNWIQSKERLVKFLGEKQEQNLRQNKLGRKYLERYFIDAIWNIDQKDINKMVRNFNSTPINKSTRPLKAKYFLTFLVKGLK